MSCWVFFRGLNLTTSYPYCYVPNSGGTIFGIFPLYGDNPSISASFIDQANFAQKVTVNSNEGNFLHIAFDRHYITWGGGRSSIKYNQITSNAAGTALTPQYATSEEPSNWARAGYHYFPNFQWTWNGTAVYNQILHAKPSLAVDDYIARNGTTYEEPIIGWETNAGQGIFTNNGTGMWMILPLQAVCLNRQGNPFIRSLWNPPPPPLGEYTRARMGADVYCYD